MTIEARSIVGRFAQSLRMVLAIIASAGFAQGAVFAQEYPVKPIRLIVPWPAGGVTDSASRILATQLSARLPHPVIVENKPGATGTIGSTFVATAPADGYTLLLASAETHGINPHTYSTLTYDPVKDFVAIAPFTINPFSLVARADFPANTVQELVELARANPGKYTYSSAGLGSASQLAMEVFRTQAQLDFLHIPHQGAAPALTSLLGGHSDLQILSVGNAASLRKAGKLKVFAVTTQERYFGLPDVPTLKEAGFDKVNIANWNGIVAPAKTPAPVVQRLYEEIQAVVKSPEAQAAFRGVGVEVYSPVSRQEFEQFLAAENSRWGEVARRQDSKPQAR